MKKLHHTFFLLCGIVVAFSTTSCIKDEKANVECDIENIVVAQEVKLLEILFQNIL